MNLLIDSLIKKYVTWAKYIDKYTSKSIVNQIISDLKWLNEENNDMNDKIKKLQEQIEAEKRKISSCKHQWEKPFYNPERKTEEYLTGEYQSAGVHHWPVISYCDKLVARWTRKCSLCGYEEHTNKQKPIIKDYEPDF